MWEMASFYVKTIENKGFPAIIANGNPEKRGDDSHVHHNVFSSKKIFLIFVIENCKKDFCDFLMRLIM